MKFSKGIRLALKIMAAIIAILVLVTIIVANSSYVQNKLVGLATDALSKQLNTEVKIDRVKLNLLGMSASIEGIKLKDQQQRDMLKVKRIWGHLRALALLKGEILLSGQNIAGGIYPVQEFFRIVTVGQVHHFAGIV